MPHPTEDSTFTVCTFRDAPQDREVVGALLILRDQEGDFSTWSGKVVGKTEQDFQLPGDEARADLHDLVSTAAQIANL